MKVQRTKLRIFSCQTVLKLLKNGELVLIHHITFLVTNVSLELVTCSHSVHSKAFQCILEGAVIADQSSMSQTHALSVIRYGLEMLQKGIQMDPSAHKLAGVFPFPMYMATVNRGWKPVSNPDWI